MTEQDYIIDEVEREMIKWFYFAERTKFPHRHIYFTGIAMGIGSNASRYFPSPSYGAINDASEYFSGFSRGLVAMRKMGRL